MKEPDLVVVALSLLVRVLGECFSPELTLCAGSYSVSVPPPCYRSGTSKTPEIVPKAQVAGAAPNHATPKHAYTLATQRSRSGLIMPLSRHSLGTYQETSSHATRKGTLGHSRLNSVD